MIKPPMHQSIFVSSPKVDEDGNPLRDRFGNKLMGAPKRYPARVRRSDAIIRNSDGKVIQTNLEIHCGSDVPIVSKQRIGFEDVNGVQGECLIERIKDSVNLSATKVYFKVVNAYE